MFAKLLAESRYAQLRLARGDWGGVVIIGCGHVDTRVRPLTGTATRIGTTGTQLNEFIPVAQRLRKNWASGFTPAILVILRSERMLLRSTAERITEIIACFSPAGRSQSSFPCSLT